MLAGLLVLVALAGCGADEAPRAAPDDPGAGAPASPPPEGGGNFPPPAWVSTARGAHWLAYGTFCWKSTCADSAGPKCGDGRTPTIVVDRGERVTFHLAFEPSKTSLEFYDEGVSVELDAGREPQWSVDQAGPAWLATAAAAGGDAAYAACLRVRGEPEPTPVREIGEVRREQPGGEIRVRGALLAEGDDVRLCEGFAESHPPQCAGESLRLEGLALEELTGVSRAGATRWRDEATIVEGRLRGTTLVVASS